MPGVFTLATLLWNFASCKIAGARISRSGQARRGGNRIGPRDEALGAISPLGSAPFFT